MPGTALRLVPGADDAPCGLLTLAPDGRIIAVNKAFSAYIGSAPATLVGRTFPSMLPVGGRLYWATHFLPTLQLHAAVHEVAFELVTVTGNRLPVLVSTAAETDDLGSLTVLHTAVYPARSRRAYEVELLRARRRAEESEARATALTRTLQQMLLPPAAPVVPGLAVDAIYRPAGNGEEVGGDFYDVFAVARDHWVVVLGDVAGKGVGAAVVTALARRVVRDAHVEPCSPAIALTRLNEALLNGNEERFLTAVVLRLLREGPRWRATLALGGHPPPLLKRAGGAAGPCGVPGSLVGAFMDATFTEQELVLDPEDSLLLFTDGVTEGRADRLLYGDDRLRTCVNAAPRAALAQAVVEDVLAFQHGDPHDDIAVVALSVPS